MKLTAQDALNYRLIDAIITEPKGGAHRDYEQIISSVKTTLSEQLLALQATPLEQLLEMRYQKLIECGLATQ